MRPYALLFGYRKFSVKSTHARRFFELCRRTEISPRGLSRAQNGDIIFDCSLLAARRLSKLAVAEKIPFEIKKGGGLPLALSRFVLRPGLLVGSAAAICLTVLSHLFLWDIRVTGNREISTEEIVSELSAAGLSRGSFLPLLDASATELALREGDARIAYVSVVIVGTVASVQVREAIATPEPAATAPANLVAARDGVITMPLIFEGKCLVHAGDVVRAGQILATGLMDTDNNGMRVTRAAGQVMAKTVRTYTVRVPFAEEQRVPTGEVGREIVLLFFGGARKVFKSTGNISNDCDIIEKTVWLQAGDGKNLPLGYIQTEYIAYRTVTVNYTAEEAMSLAGQRLEAQMAEDSPTYTLLEQRVECVADAEGITMICTAVVEEDIALVAEFSLTS